MKRASNRWTRTETFGHQYASRYTPTRIRCYTMLRTVSKCQDVQHTISGRSYPTPAQEAVKGEVSDLTHSEELSCNTMSLLSLQSAHISLDNT